MNFGTWCTAATSKDRGLLNKKSMKSQATTLTTQRVKVKRAFSSSNRRRGGEEEAESMNRKRGDSHSSDGDEQSAKKRKTTDGGDGEPDSELETKGT